MLCIINKESAGEADGVGGCEGEQLVHAAVEGEKDRRAHVAEPDRRSGHRRGRRLLEQEAREHGRGREHVRRVHAGDHVESSQLVAGAQVRQVLARERPTSQREQFLPRQVYDYLSIFFVCSC